MPWKEQHTVLDYLQHLWPYVSGVFLLLAAGFKLWWYDRNETRKLINANHAMVMQELRDLKEYNEKQHTNLVQSLTDQMIALFNGSKG